ncbi:hypothetical protein PSN01_02557 [Micromonospora saelicesensis]|nr:hypothetical protein PSN01_02557 [Micromonospora saelicesensis]
MAGSPPRPHQTTNPNSRPAPIQTALHSSASRSSMTWLSRCRSTSTASSTAITAPTAAQAQSGTATVASATDALRIDHRAPPVNQAGGPFRA